MVINPFTLTARFKVNGRYQSLKRTYKSSSSKNINKFLYVLAKESNQPIEDYKAITERIQKKCLEIEARKEREKKVLEQRPYAKMENLLSKVLNKLAEEDGYFNK